MNGYPEIVKLLLKFGADPNAINEEENTPLHIAVQMGNKSIIRALINAGANVNALNKVRYSFFWRIFSFHLKLFLFFTLL